MSEQLSQDEVEALRRGIADGEVEAQRPPVHGEVRPYDLVGEERFVGRRFQALDLVLDRLARRLRPSLAGMVGAPPEIQPAGIEMLKFGTFRNRLGSPSSLHLFTMTPLRGQAVTRGAGTEQGAAEGEGGRTPARRARGRPRPACRSRGSAPGSASPRICARRRVTHWRAG